MKKRCKIIGQAFPHRAGRAGACHRLYGGDSAQFSSQVINRERHACDAVK